MKAAAGIAFAALVVSLPATHAAAGPRPHPGDAITVEGGGGCTLGFLFSGSDGASYMSTAGHCLGLEAPQQRTWAKGAGPAVSTDQGQIGRVVFAEDFRAPEVREDYDFALVRLDPGVQASSEIRVYGTPTGMNDVQAADPEVLRVYGHGTVFSQVSKGRELVAPNTQNKDHVYVHGPVFFGDSGAPVIDEEGRALGTVLGAGLRLGAGDGLNDATPNIIGRLGPVVKHASESLRITLALAKK